MSELKTRMRDDFLAQNLAEIEKLWSEGDASAQARMWPKRFVYESFITNPTSPKKTDVLTVEVDDWGNKITAAAAQLNIHCECQKMGGMTTGQRLVAVGKDAQAVKAKFAELVREAERASSRVKQQKVDEVGRKYAEAKRVKGPLKADDPAQMWDVTGTWTLSCPEIEQGWGRSNDDSCSLDIYFTRPDLDGRVQIFANFEFIVIEGTMRFVNPRSTERSNDCLEGRRRRRRQR